MKIAYLMQYAADIRKPPFDGPANHVRKVIQHLQLLGHEVVLIFGIDGKIWTSTNMDEFTEISGLKVDEGWKRSFERIIRRLQHDLHLPYIGYFESMRFASACEAVLSEVDILFERLSWMGYGGVFASRRLRIPLVLEFNGDPLHDLEAKKIAPKGIQKLISSKLLRFTLDNANKIIASGAGWRKNLIQKWQQKSEKAVVIENGSDLVSLLARNQLHNIDLENNGNQEVSIVYLGGFYAWHGTKILINVFSRLIRKFVGIKLIMIGSGPGLEESKELVKKLDIEPFVQFTGQTTIESYAKILANADIGVSPYCGWIEYSGLKLFDYKAAGLAIVASGENGHPLTLADGQNGLIIPPCDENALENALSRLIKDQPLRQRLGQAARSDAEQMHTWRHTVQEIEKELLALQPETWIGKRTTEMRQG